MANDIYKITTNPGNKLCFIYIYMIYSLLDNGDIEIQTHV